jgi:hypothetical protein
MAGRQWNQQTFGMIYLGTKAKPVRPVIPQVPVVFWQVTDADWPGA